MGEPGGPDDEDDEFSERVDDDAVSDDVASDDTGDAPDAERRADADAGGDESDGDEGPRYDPELGDPREYVDEDDEVPDWVEEAKAERNQNKAARRERGGRYVDPHDDADGTDGATDREDDPADDDGPGGVGESDANDDVRAERPTSPSTGTDGGAVGSVDDGMFGGDAAPDDEEMPLTEHVEEMALRIMAVGLVVVGVGAITLFYADDLINFLWYSFIGPGVGECLNLGTMTVRPSCPEQFRPRVYHPLALVLARLKMASLVGFVVALPVAVYQTYRFMRPGLYPHERRYYLAAVPTSLVLATVGVGFAYFAVLPAMFEYFTRYSERAAEIAFGLTETFNLIVLMLGFFALVFQIPLLVMLAIMMGVTTRQWLADRRLYFWGGFAAVAFLFSPDPTGMAPLMVAATMIALFDGTLVLLKWTSSESLVPTADGLAARRPYAWVVAVLVGYLLSPAPVPQGYYDQLPPAVVETLAANDLVSMTPVLIAAGLIGLFELGAYVLRQTGRSERGLRARLFVHRIRIPVWVLAVVVGYFGSPEPVLLYLADDVALGTTEAIAVTGGLLILYELAIGVLRWRGQES